MADTAVAITAGSGTNIDTRTEATNGNHRQVIVVGDPATNAGVAPVDATTGLVVNIGPGVDLGSGTGGSKTPRVLIDSAQLGSLQTTAVAMASPGYSPVALPTDQVWATAAHSLAVTITRPANTTAYTAGDCVGTCQTFTTMGLSGGRVEIVSASLEYDVTAIPSGMTSFRLYLYNVTIPSAPADNAAFDLPSGDRASFLGYIDLGTPADLGSTLYCEVNAIGKQLKLSGTSIFGQLVTNGGYTPAANSETIVLTLHTREV